MCQERGLEVFGDVIEDVAGVVETGQTYADACLPG
jgi:hypothetical protein